jgi:hypothetical protein
MELALRQCRLSYTLSAKFYALYCKLYVIAMPLKSQFNHAPLPNFSSRNSRNFQGILDDGVFYVAQFIQVRPLVRRP